MCIRIFAGLFLLLQCSFAVAEVTKVTVAIDHAPPYSYTNDVAQPSGLILDILRPISQELGIEIKTVTCPFSRCIHMLEQGEADVMGANSHTAKRAATHVRHPSLHGAAFFFSLLFIACNRVSRARI